MTTLSSHDKTMRKLKQAKIQLMRNPKFALWSGILMVGKTYIKDEIPTAATNGRDEFYGTKFVNTLNTKELAFVVLHENLHKALRHMTTWRKIAKENLPLANAAMDYVINGMLVEMDPREKYIAVPKIGDQPMALIDKKYNGMHTKQVYDLLKQQKQSGKGQAGKGGPNDPGNSSGQASGNFDEHDWSGAEALTDAERQTLEREIDQAIRQGKIAASKLHGDGAGNLCRELGELQEPQIDWREALREFVSAACAAKDVSSWRKINRRFISSGVYLPTLIGETVGKLVIGIDTSGSIGAEALNNFLSEVKSIASDVHPEKIDLIYWDTAVASHEEYDYADLDNLIQSTRAKGGGGTAPGCVEEYLNSKNITPECIIMLTDGYVPNWGAAWPAPVLWVVAGNPDAEATIGVTLHIKE